MPAIPAERAPSAPPNDAPPPAALVVERLRDVAKPLAAETGELDRAGLFRRDRWQRLAKTGLLGLPIAADHGGSGEDVPATALALEALGAACDDGGLGFAATSHMAGGALAIDRFGTAEQRARFLPALCRGTWIAGHAITEAEAGSDAWSLTTRARRRGATYVLDGEKCFITNAPVADLLVVYARTGNRTGSPRTAPLGGISAFIVPRDTPGLSIGRSHDKLGLRTALMADVGFDGCVVPEANRLGKEGRGALMFDRVMRWEIVLCFAVTVGAMQRQLRQCIAHARERRQFGVPIGKHQAVAHIIADMRIRLDAARALLREAAARVQSGRDVAVPLAVAKTFVSEAYVASSLDAIQLFGARGYLTASGIERDLRDAVGGKIYSGSSEIQRTRIASFLGL